MKWIKVEDQLPEKYIRVLAYGYGIGCGCLGTDELAIQFCRLDRNGNFEFGEYDCGLNATHWMPLPEPPKQET